jgi:uncharacterized protein YndB with AHSA1/START domain
MLPARPEEVWQEWIDPAAMADWMCPRPARCLGVELEPVVGGRLRIDIEEAGVRFVVSGEFRELDPPSRLVFTWTCSTWPDPTAISVVTVTLAPRPADATLMTIEHALLPGGLSDQHASGWSTIADQLATTLKQRC